MKATCCLFLHKYKSSKKGEIIHPVNLRITFLRKSKYFYLGIRLTEADYSRLFQNKHFRQQREELTHYLKKAEHIIDELLDNFTWDEFEKMFFKKKETSSKPDLMLSMANYMEYLKNRGQIKTFQTYHSTLTHIIEFGTQKQLYFSDITPEWLENFSAYLAARKLKSASIGIYMRNIRSIFNREISLSNLQPTVYPFGKNKYRPPSSTRVKKALTVKEVAQIFNYKPLSENEAWARDIWMFSYLASGMNIKDIALLKYENIKDNEIQFLRAKTMKSIVENQRAIHIPIHEELHKLILKWGNQEKKPDNYIFDILTPHDHTPEQQTRDVNQAVKTINKYMKRIGRTLELSKLPTCNFARHTYSTVLKRANVPIELISEALGHTSIKTTEIYLDSFEKEQMAEISKLLLPKILIGG
jgi:site-specific recombinase XerD